MRYGGGGLSAKGRIGREESNGSHWSEGAVIVWSLGEFVRGAVSVSLTGSHGIKLPCR